MSTPQPLLFRGKTQDLQKEIERKLRDPNGLGWQSQEGGAGRAMLSLFGRYADIIIARLNQVPRQHFLAFLSEGGIDQLPPCAATTRLAFVPEDDARPVIAIPAQTQVATRASADQPEIIFETGHTIQVIPTKLNWCFTLDQRTSADRTSLANSLEPGASFAAFQGEDVRERILYLQHELLSFADPVTRARAAITLHFELDPQVQPTGEWTLAWAYFDGKKKEWVDLTATGAQVTDDTGRLMRTGDVCFTRFPELADVKVNGNTGKWLACRLEIEGDTAQWPGRGLAAACQEVKLPQIRGVTIRRKISIPGHEVTPQVLTATQAGAAFAQVKPEDAFYPFGLYPALLDGLYIQARDAFEKSGATVKLEFRGDGLPTTIENTSVLAALTVVWEYFSTDGWQRLGESHWGSTACTSQRLGFCDTTAAFTAQDQDPGTVSFTVPSPGGDDPCFAEMEVNGQKGYWIRAYIEKGGYSEPQAAASGLLQRMLLGKLQPPPPKALPPLVRNLLVWYEDYYPPEETGTVKSCLGTTDGRWSSFVTGQGFRPFSASVEQPALCLGFLPLAADPAKGLDADPVRDRPAFPRNTWVELYFGIEETNDEREYLELEWQYWDGQKWQALGIVDQTSNFSRSGTVGFFGPPDHRHSPEFGRDAYWLCVRRATARSVGKSGAPGETKASLVAQGIPALPRITAIRLNTVLANNGESLDDSILGSSNGERNQVRVLARAPVLPDIQIEVREQDETTEAADQTWIAWKRVPNLLSYGPTDRCYTLDPTSGTVAFGDGEHGMIPLAGQNNIRVTRYRTHNGKTGNVDASTVIVLRSPHDALNEIRRVSNFEPATSGADLEETADVELRGPYSLKNRGRAITGQDFEWLAREVIGVRRVYCLPATRADGRREPGWVTVLVIPGPNHTLNDPDGRPVPAPFLLRQVREYLEARGLVNLSQSMGEVGDGVADATVQDPDQIQVTGPGFVEVEVVAKVVATDPEEADSVRTAILEQLRTFLDPVEGGPDRTGWQPGRDVYISEVKAEIENVKGVDHVYFDRVERKSAHFRTPGRQLQHLGLDGQENLTAEMPRGSLVSTYDRRVAAVLAVTLPEGAPVREAPVFGFSDGDLATIAGEQGPALPFARRLSVQHDNPAQIRFSQPADFSDAAAFTNWKRELGGEPALVSASGRIRATIVDMKTHEDTSGRVYLSSVEVRGFQAGDVVVIADAEHANHRVEPLEVTTASPLAPVSAPAAAAAPANSQELSVVFVPPGHLVFSGKHDIQMVV